MSNSKSSYKRDKARNADPKLLKEVLQVVESSSFSRQEIEGLDSVCFKVTPGFFPLEKRDALRRKWDALRRLRIKNYHTFLLSIGVQPGPATLRELQEERERAKQHRNSSHAKNKNTDLLLGVEEEDDSEEEEYTVASLSNTFEDLDLSSHPHHQASLFTPPPASLFTPPGSSLQTTDPEQLLQQFSLCPRPPPASLFTPPGSSLQTTDPEQLLQQFSPCPRPLLAGTMDHPPTVASLAGSSGLSFSTEGSLGAVEGTKAYPFKFMVNREYPEKNPARIKFTRVMNYEHEGFEHVVWEAAITIPHGDLKKWDAYFQKPNQILFKGPSRSYWEDPDILWNPDCHDVKNKNTHPFPDDQATKKAHNASELAIEKNSLRNENWWQAEIPCDKVDGADVVLDNNILSGNSHLVKKEVRKLKARLYGAEVKGLVLVWKIAEVGGIQTERQMEAVPDVQSLMEM
jgi:hypothetical protein